RTAQRGGAVLPGGRQNQPRPPGRGGRRRGRHQDSAVPPPRPHPQHLHLNEVNPHLALDGTRFRMPREAQPWCVTEGPRRGAVSSFGLGGTNGHVILEEAPWAAGRVANADRPVRPFRRQRYWLPSAEAAPRESDGDLLYRV